MRTVTSTSAEYIKEQEAFDAQSKLFQDQTNQYNKNVSIMAMVFAVLMLIVSLTLFKRITIIADGLLLGGVLTLAYSIIRGFGSEDDLFRFFVVGAGLVTAMVLGYIKFVTPQTKKSKSLK